MRLSNRLKSKLISKFGPWALVTGATSGIGRELASRLAEAGLNLVLTGRNSQSLDGLASTLEAEYGVQTKRILADLSELSELHFLIREIDQIELGLYIASAGFGTSGPFIMAETEEELNMLQVNCTALMMLTHFFARKFAEKRKGGIILMSSIVGFQGTPNAANYAATKAYVQSLAEGLYHELKPYKVSVLAAAPGPVASGFASRARMRMGNTLKPENVGVPILRALGKRATVFPGGLTQVLIFGLRTVPRWGKIRIMKLVMFGMTKHQNVLKS